MRWPAGDLELAARLMEQGLRDVLNREDRPTLERWLRLLPADLIERRPGMLMLKPGVDALLAACSSVEGSPAGGGADREGRAG